MLDVNEMEEQYVLTGFKPALMPIISAEFQDFTDSGLSDFLFGKEVKLFVMKNDEKRDMIHAIEVMETTNNDAGGKMEED